jgi:hypothetical protein
MKYSGPWKTLYVIISGCHTQIPAELWKNVANICTVLPPLPTIFHIKRMQYLTQYSKYTKLIECLCNII